MLWGDARQFLYPLIQTWPTPSASAETLLVCREGDAVLYLNDLRHQHDTALKLRIPLTQTNLPAVMAVLGREGIFRGKDYRGVEVLSALKAVPNSPWFIVAKVDAAEAFAAWRWRSVLILVLLLASLALACAATLVVWQRHEKAHYRALFYSEIALIKERKRAAEHIQKVNAELEERVRERTGELEAANKELEAFSYSVSHDLRAPLRAVEGFSRILEEQSAGGLDGEGQRLLGIIRGETLRMGRLIDALLAFSRAGRRAPGSSEIDMRRLAEEVTEECGRLAAGRQVRFRAGSLLPGLGDRVMVRQVLVNLVGNAVKYTRPRGEAEIELGSRSEGNENVYWVRDNGVGFDPRYSNKLFGVFQRLHSEEEFEGTGVGLALVQRIVRRHGGRVWAESEVNKGATFYFTLRNRNV
jgi:signal transduction histidine kinase